jgi:hypothetical protein
MTDDDQPRHEWTKGKSGDGKPVPDGEVPLLARAMAAMSSALILFCEQEQIKLHDVVIGMRTDTDDRPDEPNALCGFIDGHEARGLPSIDVPPSPVLDALLFHLRETGAAEGVGIGVMSAQDLFNIDNPEAMN